MYQVNLVLIIIQKQIKIKEKPVERESSVLLNGINVFFPYMWDVGQMLLTHSFSLLLPQSCAIVALILSSVWRLKLWIFVAHKEQQQTHTQVNPDETC